MGMKMSCLIQMPTSGYITRIFSMRSKGSHPASRLDTSPRSAITWRTIIALDFQMTTAFFNPSARFSMPQNGPSQSRLFSEGFLNRTNRDFGSNSEPPRSGVRCAPITIRVASAPRRPEKNAGRSSIYQNEAVFHRISNRLCNIVCNIVCNRLCNRISNIICNRLCYNDPIRIRIRRRESARMKRGE